MASRAASSEGPICTTRARRRRARPQGTSRPLRKLTSAPGIARPLVRRSSASAPAADEASASLTVKFAVGSRSACWAACEARTASRGLSESGVSQLVGRAWDTCAPAPGELSGGGRRAAAEPGARTHPVATLVISCEHCSACAERLCKRTLIATAPHQVRVQRRPRHRWKALDECFPVLPSASAA